MLVGYLGWDLPNWGFAIDGAIFQSGVFVRANGKSYPVLLQMCGPKS